MKKYVIRFIAFLLCVSLMTPMTALAAKRSPTEYFTNEKESVSRVITLPNGESIRFYAQNDKLWSALIYDVKKTTEYRSFGTGGCSPTALAVIVANMVPREELDKILAYQKVPYALCEHAVSDDNCA